MVKVTRITVAYLGGFSGDPLKNLRVESREVSDVIDYVIKLHYCEIGSDRLYVNADARINENSLPADNTSRLINMVKDIVIPALIGRVDALKVVAKEVHGDENMFDVVTELDVVRYLVQYLESELERDVELTYRSNSEGSYYETQIDLVAK